MPNDPTPQAEADICIELAVLPDDATLTAKALGRILGRSVRSVDRAVARGELPAGMTFMGRRMWLAKSIRDHLRARQSAAQRAVARRPEAASA